MDNLIINIESNNDYILKMLDLITKFTDEVNKMKSYSNKLVWVSSNKDLILNKYELELNNYLKFAKNLYQVITKLKEFNSDFAETTLEIKEKMTYLEKELGIGEIDE